MFGFLKKLTKKSEPAPPPSRSVSPSAPASAPVSAPAARTPSAPPPSTPSASKTVLPPASSRPASAPAPAPVMAAAETATFSKETVDLPLRELWAKLNPAVVQTATGQPDASAMLRIPANIVQAQVAKGALRIPYAQLRQFSPAGLFPADPAKDALEVDLPLSEVLPRIKPELLAKRAGQKRLEVPDDIGNIFGTGAPGLRVADSKKPPAAPPPKSGAPAAASTAAPAATLAPSAALAAAPAAMPSAPLRPTGLPLPPAPKPAAPPAPLAPAAAAPALVPPPAAPSENEPIRAPKLDPSLATLKPKGVETFTLPLMDVSAFWSEKGKNDLAGLYRHSLEIPVSTLEAALKTGKLNFLWREVRPWVRLAPGTTLPGIADDLPVELPLSIVAPRFMEQRGMAKPKKKLEPGSDIPDVFAIKSPPPAAPAPAAPAPAAPAPAAPAPAAPAPAAAAPAAAAPAAAAPVSAAAPPSVPSPAPGPLVAPAAAAHIDLSSGTGAKPLLAFGEIFGQPEKKEWSLTEVTQKTSGLRGVSGTIIATSDGLLVAGNWPGGVKTEAVAAFVPQMYSRIVQYTKELKLGEPGHFTLLIENVPLQIFKTGANYFTVLGRAGENLPKAQLQALALRLAADSAASSPAS